MEEQKEETRKEIKNDDVMQFSNIRIGHPLESVGDHEFNEKLNTKIFNAIAKIGEEHPEITVEFSTTTEMFKPVRIY